MGEQDDGFCGKQRQQMQGCELATSMSSSRSSSSIDSNDGVNGGPIADVGRAGERGIGEGKWRKCAGAIIFNRRKEVLIGRRKDNANNWQFPQGGIEEVRPLCYVCLVCVRARKRERERERERASERASERERARARARERG